MSELNQLWADGKPLAQLFAEVLENTPVDEAAAKRLPPKDTPIDPKNSWASFGYAMGWMRLEEDRRREAIERLRRSFVGGQTRAIGRYWIGPTNAVLAEITDWIGAELSPEANKVQSGGVTFDMVQVIKLADPKASDPVSEPPKQKGPGRPSWRAEIRAAIIHFAAADDWFTANSPDVREKTYRRYIKATYRIDTVGTPGFDPKTFQKYETEYRQESDR